MPTMKSTIVALAAASACVLAACGDLTRVTNTGIVQPSSENSAVGANARAAGAAHLFYGAYSNAAYTAAMFSDEAIGTDFVGNSGEGFILNARRPVTPSFPTSASFNVSRFMN